MRHVTDPLFYVACRRGLIEAEDGRFRGRYRTEPVYSRSASVAEFETPDGTVIARRVVAASGESACWLRADIADRAEAALEAERAESARIAAEVVSFSLGRDEQRAAEHGMTVEQYRAKRNFALQRIDQRRGRNSVGM
jgi:hypothetical protein